VFCALRDQLASLGRHAQLTRCFSAVAELLVIVGSAEQLNAQLLSKKQGLAKVFKYPQLCQEWVKLQTSNLAG